VEFAKDIGYYSIIPMSLLKNRYNINSRKTMMYVYISGFRYVVNELKDTNDSITIDFHNNNNNILSNILCIDNESRQCVYI